MESFDETQLTDNKRASVVDIQGSSLDSSSDSIRATGPSHTDGGRKRKMVVSSEVPLAEKQKKRRTSVSLDDISTCITEDDVKRLFRTANISSDDYEYLVPSESHRANRPPQGYIAVYEEQIKAGLRFPLHDLIVKICNLIKVSPSQLMPNAYRAIVGFVLCAKYYDIPVTSSPFFCLFNIIPSNIEGLFHLSQIKGMGFLEGKSLPIGPWKNRFFYLRRKSNSWNCITEWSTMPTKPVSDAYVALAAVEKGILKHHFRVNELISKELLVHGGIEPGAPSPEFTFRLLMDKAVVTTFDLLRDELTAPASGLKISPPRPPQLTDCSASPAQLSDQQHVNHQQLQSASKLLEISSETGTPVDEHLPASSGDGIPLNDLFNKNQNHESESRKARMETNSRLPVTYEAKDQSIPLAVCIPWQNIDSTYVLKDHYQKLEKKAEEISSDLKSTKSRIQELELFEARSSAAHEAMKIHGSELAHKESHIQKLKQELEVSEAKRVDSECKTHLAKEDMKNLEKRTEEALKIRDSDLAYKESQIQKLMRELEVSEAKRADYENKTYLANENIKNLEKRAEEALKIRDSELAHNESQIQELMRKLEVSEAKRADSENKTHWAINYMKNVERGVEEALKNRDSELAHKESQIQKLKWELGVSEAKRVDSENNTHLANVNMKNLEKRVTQALKIRDLALAYKESQIQQLKREINVSVAKSAESDKIAKNAIEEFRSSSEYINLVQAANVAFNAIDTNFFDMPIDECGNSSELVDQKCPHP